MYFNTHLIESKYKTTMFHPSVFREESASDELLWTLSCELLLCILALAYKNGKYYCTFAGGSELLRKIGGR